MSGSNVFNAQGVAIIGKVKDWHDPRGECQHNEEPSFDCTCKRPVKRKPFRVVRVHDESVDLHKIPKDIVIEIHPHGLIRLRSKKGRTYFDTTAATIYARLLWAESMKAAKAKKAARRKR